MAFSVSSVISSIVSATTRAPHAVKLPPEQDRFSRRNQSVATPIKTKAPLDLRPYSVDAGKTSEALEHDTLTRIRDALYRDQQA